MTTDGPYTLRDYILTPSSSDSPAHTNTDVYTPSHRLADAVLLAQTSQQNHARDTAGGSQHSQDTVKSEERGI